MHHVKDIIFLRDPGAMYIFRLLLNPSPNMGIPSHFFLITELHRDATIVVISLNLQFCTSSICINRHTTNLYQHARDSCSMSGRATAVRSCIASPRVRGCAPTSGAGGGTVGHSATSTVCLLWSLPRNFLQFLFFLLILSFLRSSVNLPYLLLVNGVEEAGGQGGGAVTEGDWRHGRYSALVETGGGWRGELEHTRTTRMALCGDGCLLDVGCAAWEHQGRGWSSNEALLRRGKYRGRCNTGKVQECFFLEEHSEILFIAVCIPADLPQIFSSNASL